MRLAGKLNKTKANRKIKHKSRETNPKNKPKMSKFMQRHAQIAFCGKLKQQKRHDIPKKAIYRTISAKNKPKNKQLSAKTSNPQVLKKTRKSTKNKPRPNLRENRKVGNTGAQRGRLSGNFYVAIISNT